MDVGYSTRVAGVADDRSTVLVTTHDGARVAGQGRQDGRSREFPATHHPSAPTPHERAELAAEAALLAADGRVAPESGMSGLGAGGGSLD
jgi:hypothetical protein